MRLSDEAIVELFFDVGRLNRSYSERVYGCTNPYKGQLRCLLFLAEAGEVSQKELAEQLSVRQSSASDILSKLEKKGLTRRIPSETDRRVSLISLTEQGVQEAERIRKSRARVHSEMLTDLNETEKEQLYLALQKIKQYYLSKKETDHDK